MKNKKCMSGISQQGFALVFVIMVMAVLMILGTALLTLSVAESKSSSRDVFKMKAHYIAQAGVDATAKSIIKNPSEVAGLIGTTKTGNIGEGSFSATITGDPNTKVKITSVGTIGTDYSDTITLELIEDTSYLFKNAVYTESPLDFSGEHKNLEISGPLQSEGSIIPPTEDLNGNSPYEDYWDVKDNEPMYLPPFTIPTASPFDVKKNIIIDKKIAIINQEGYYNDINLTNDTLIFNIPDAKTFRVVVDNIDVKDAVIINCLDAGGNIVTNGTGILHLYVKNRLSVQTPATSGMLNLVVFLGTPNPVDPGGPYLNGGTYDMKGNGNFRGYIYGPECTVNGNSGQITFEGAIICKDFNMTNGELDYKYIELDLDLSDALSSAFKKSLYSNP